MKSIIYSMVLVFTLLLSQVAYAETVWVDVRSVVENKIDNIEGDIRISHADIVDEAYKAFPDKNTEIKLYCRSGIRAGKALSALTSAGYTNVENVGSINDARNIRAIPIK